MKDWPTSLNVMGLTYRIFYTDSFIDTDAETKRQLLGQIDYKTRTIRICIGKDQFARQAVDVMSTILHETIHAILTENKWITSILKDECEEVLVDQLGTLLADTLTRNKLFELPAKRPKVSAKK